MPDIEPQSNRWQSAGALDAEAAGLTRALDSKDAAQTGFGTPGGLGWMGVTAVVCAAILIACGAILLVSTYWEQFTPGARFALAIGLVAVFHIAGGLLHPSDLGSASQPSLGTKGLARPGLRSLSIALHAVGTFSSGAAIILVGEIFNLDYHWPNIVLLWALAALAGWVLLRDQAQQTLALVLVPGWIFCELGVRLYGSIGDSVYLGRLAFVWGILYITFFLISQRKAVRGILFAAGVVVAIGGIFEMLSCWASFSAGQSFIPFGARAWAWIAIAAVPLIVAAFHGHKGLIPIVAAIAFAIALPWCYYTWTETYNWGNGGNHILTGTNPSLAAYALVAAFALFLCWCGVRMASRALVNLGIAAFAAAVAWFYFSNIYSDKYRAAGLIGLGVLFLAGGWALTIARRRILARMKSARPAPPQAVPGSQHRDLERRGTDGGTQ